LKAPSQRLHFNNSISFYKGRRIVPGCSDSLAIAQPHHSPSLAGYWTTSDCNIWYPMPKGIRHLEPPLIYMHAAARRPSRDLNSTTASLLVLTSVGCSVKCQHVSELDEQSSFKYEVTQPSSLQTSCFRQVGCNAKRRHELLQGRCMHTSHLPSPCNRCRTSIPLERMRVTVLTAKRTSRYVYIRVFYLEHRGSAGSSRKGRNP
jgi:hypothetical protein